MRLVVKSEILLVKAAGGVAASALAYSYKLPLALDRAISSNHCKLTRCELLLDFLLAHHGGHLRS